MSQLINDLFRFFAIIEKVNIKMLKEGMTIEARHVKRKQLNQYLDSDLLKRERRSMESLNNFSNSVLANKKRLSTELAQQQQLSSTKRSRTSESVSFTILQFNCVSVENVMKLILTTKLNLILILYIYIYVSQS